MDISPNVRCRGPIPRIFPRDVRPVRAQARPFRCLGKAIVVHIDLVGGESGSWIFLVSVSRSLFEEKEQIALIQACSAALARADVEAFFKALDVNPAGRRWMKVSRG